MKANMKKILKASGAVAVAAAVSLGLWANTHRGDTTSLQDQVHLHEAASKINNQPYVRW